MGRGNPRYLPGSGRRRPVGPDGVPLDLRSESSEDLSSVLDEMMGRGAWARLGRNRRAAMAWFKANGDVERRHTSGVYLKRAASSGLPPVLVVYVDSHARLTDFMANREIYLVRLAAVGFEVSGVEFRLSREPVPEAPSSQQATSRPAEVVLPPLSDDERRRAAELTADLPEPLRQRVRRAMELSMRREKLDNTSK
ncbi:MAG: hypothetical protein LKJ49_01630 [Olsenella sp.]|nr:hypothetical protein [Olsenella sp.]